MENFSVKECVVYGVVPLAAVVLFLKPGILVSIRQRWLALWVSSHSTNKWGHSHSHGDSGKPDMKKALFESLTSQTTSEVPVIKGRTGIRILEIGVGAGANFEFFPSNCTFIAVDPNPHFDSLVKDNLAKFPGIQMERRLLCGAEDMKEVDDESVDAVVGTGVFCQINNVQNAFDEIKRILIPGGNFYFIDHLPNRKHTFKRIFFDILSWTRIAKLIFNANLHRNVNEDIEKAGFSVLKKELVEHGGQLLVVGVATK